MATTLAEQLKKVHAQRLRRAVYEDLIHLLKKNRHQVPSGFGTGVVPLDVVQGVLDDLEATVEIIREDEFALENQTLTVEVPSHHAQVIPISARRNGKK